MAEKLTFTSVELDKFGRSKTGVVAKFTSSLNSQVIGKMGWSEIPECMTGADLEGEIVCISLELIPDEGLLKKHAIQLELAQITSFKTVRLELEGKKGKGHRTELRFAVTSMDVKGARKLEEYMLTAGKSKLVVSYEKQAKQEDLPGTERDTGCVQCNNGIEFDEDDPKLHISGKKCTARPVQEEMAN